LRARDISEAQVSADLTDFLRRFEGKVNWASTRIQRESTNHEIRRKAIRWRALLVPAAQAAAFQPTAGRGLIDIWALVLQMDHYFRDGHGHDYFGEHQQIALDTCAELVSAVEALEPDLPIEDTAQLKTKIETWVGEHPLGKDGYARHSTAPRLASLIGDVDQSFGDTLRSIAERLEVLSERITIYGDSMPRQVRWQAELMAEEMLLRPEIAGMFRDIAVTGDSLAKLSEIEEFIGSEIERLEQIAEAERVIILKDVDRQRTETLSAVTQEREAILADVDRQRTATIEALEEETAGAIEKGDAIAERVLASVRETRAELIQVVDDEHQRVFKDAQQLASRTLDESMLEARGLIDHAVLRTVQGGAVLIALFFAAAVLYRKLTR